MPDQWEVNREVAFLPEHGQIAWRSMALSMANQSELATQIYHQRVGAYEAEAASLMSQFDIGDPSQFHLRSSAITQQIWNNARRDARSIVNTYNRDLARMMRGELGPGVNRTVLAARARIWTDSRMGWKSRQVALNNVTMEFDRAQQDFVKYNQITGALWEVVPYEAAEVVCEGYVAGNPYPTEEVMALDIPAHINCVHYRVLAGIEGDGIMTGGPLTGGWQGQDMPYPDALGKFRWSQIGAGPAVFQEQMQRRMSNLFAADNTDWREGILSVRPTAEIKARVGPKVWGYHERACPIVIAEDTSRWLQMAAADPRILYERNFIIRPAANALEHVVHEMHHVRSTPYYTAGGYRGLGKALEEGLTEGLARERTTEWARRLGFDIPEGQHVQFTPWAYEKETALIQEMAVEASGITGEGAASVMDRWHQTDWDTRGRVIAKDLGIGVLDLDRRMWKALAGIEYLEVRS